MPVKSAVTRYGAPGLLGQRRIALGAILLLSTASSLAADEWTDGIPPSSIATSLPNNGDPGGIRKWLSERGLTYSFVYTGEVLGNVAGGLRRGGVYQGRLEGMVNADLEKILGLRGLSFFVNGFQIHNTGGVRRDLTGSFTTISSIEALPTTRLSELWLEQKLFNDTLSIRAGQLIADSDFFISDTSTFFMNSGWPSIFALNMPSGGPSFPFAAPGVRMRYEPNKQVALLAAIYNGDPAGPGPEEPEIKNRHGVNFRVNDPPLLMGEAQYRYNQEKIDTGLAGILRVGFWHHFGEFDSQRFDNTGLSLANPFGSGIAARLRGNTGVYGVIDQQIYRPAAPTAASVSSAAPPRAFPIAIRCSSISTAESCLTAWCRAGRTTGSARPSSIPRCRAISRHSTATRFSLPECRSRCAITN